MPARLPDFGRGETFASDATRPVSGRPSTYPLRMSTAAATANAPANFPAARAAPAVLDIEASGFGAHSYPIEIGFVLPNGDTYCSLIRPANGWVHWDPEAEKVHHIAAATLGVHGRDVDEVAGQLNDRLHGRTVYSDAWLHDYTWLAALFEAAGRVPAFRLEDLRSLLTEAEAAHWDDVKGQVRSELRLERHRASADARVLQQTVVRVRLAAADAG